MPMRMWHCSMKKLKEELESKYADDRVAYTKRQTEYDKQNFRQMKEE